MFNKKVYVGVSESHYQLTKSHVFYIISATNFIFFLDYNGESYQKLFVF